MKHCGSRSPTYIYLRLWIILYITTTMIPMILWIPYLSKHRVLICAMWRLLVKQNRVVIHGITTALKGSPLNSPQKWNRASSFEVVSTLPGGHCVPFPDGIRLWKAGFTSSPLPFTSHLREALPSPTCKSKQRVLDLHNATITTHKVVNQASKTALLRGSPLNSPQMKQS